MCLYVHPSPTRIQVLHAALFSSVGHDARKAALDGFPVKQIIVSDVRQGENSKCLFSLASLQRSVFEWWSELWDLGHVLFRSSPDSFPATFVNGDVFDLSPFTSGSQLPTEVNVSNITTLNVLHGKVSAIWASSLFHVSLSRTDACSNNSTPFSEAFLRARSTSTCTCTRIAPVPRAWQYPLWDSRSIA